MQSFLQDNYFWKLYPALKWQIPLLYFSGLFLAHHFNLAFQFTFLFVILFSLYIYPFRIPQPTPYPSHAVQICNTDGTCRNVHSDSHNNPLNIFSPVYGTVDRIEIRPDDDGRVVIAISSMFLDAYAIYTPCTGKISWRDNTIIIRHERGPIEIKCLGWRVKNTLLEEGDLIPSGKYIGMANKVEITIPCSNAAAGIMVREGDRVEGFNTVMAKWR